ncbi:MAG TPA: RHO alpha subunit C-terminal catalytic domain-containing protein [Pirellulales bacterium]|jgi:phenylpropionate dioxygenase-like ring-hydroxylating dioxygenase large terminal subunit|nr:RHO alpha subunit C-terminal catalytic domain-containing protein [Pirellulales bacterium]
MFVHSTRLPHVLSPDCYWSAEQHARELDVLFRPGWHLAGTIDELARSGSFLTLDVLGHPVRLDNREGRWQACSSFCDPLRVEQCGRLLFVSLDAGAPSLTDSLGDHYATLAAACGPGWRPVWSHSLDLEANWKVPLENSVESYHIPAVHPQTFKATPEAERITHVLEPRWTSFQVTRAAHSRIETLLFTLDDGLLRWLGRTPTCGYTHYHFFPNLVLSSTDTTSLCLSFTPLAPQRCRACIRMFAYEGERTGWLQRQACRAWGLLNRALGELVLSEDFRIYPAIQRGLAASRQPGCLGAIEERIYAFQQYIAKQCSPGGGLNRPAQDAVKV